MAISQQLDTVIQMIRAWRERESTTVEQMRTNVEVTMAEFQAPEDVKWEPVDAGGVPAEWIVAPGAAADRVLMYLHGGGYVVCSLTTHRGMVSRISRAADVKALGLDYCLAPENPFPAAVDDSVASYRWLMSSGVDPSRVVIGGDSAGGGLAVATLVALRDAGDPMPAAGVCLSPWVDLEGIGESMTTKADVDPMVLRQGLQSMAKMYIGNEDPRTPLAAPLYADLHGLPPLLIQVGTSETLLDDSTRLAERAKAAGVDVTLEIFDDMIHVWQMFAPILPEGQRAIGRIGEFIRQHMG